MNHPDRGTVWELRIMGRAAAGWMVMPSGVPWASSQLYDLQVWGVPGAGMTKVAL